MGFNPFASTPALAPLETTGDTGYALVNGTGNIFSWTAPNDGNLHMVFLTTAQHVSSAETGGAITFETTDPSGTAVNPTAYAGGSGAGSTGFATQRLVQPGSTVTLAQTSALTVGAATLWATLWGF
jgi:hypothetical protein